MKSSKKKALTITLGAILMVVTIGITYAFISLVLIGEKEIVINAGVLDLVLEEENAITISDALPMHDAVGMIQEDVFVFRLVNKTSNPTNYILKLSKINVDNELHPSDVKYYLTKDGVGEPKLLSSLAVDGTVDSGTIEGNDTIDYTLRLWIDSNVTSNDAIAGKTLSYKIDVEVSQETAKSSSSAEVKLFADENLGSNCKTYDDGVDTFLVGQCSNNYVWYSGKLWRVVLKNNETGAIKMVTDNGITTIPFLSQGTDFENSYVDQWLNQEFLPTLHDYEKYLVVNSDWNATLDASETPARPLGTTLVNRTVGLLNSYEYYTTYKNSDGLSSADTTYLYQKLDWWLLTPSSKYELKKVWHLGISSEYRYNYLEVRPSVNLKGTINIDKGTGDINNPYVLEGDEQTTINGITTINTRYSGEYITFNNELYRIVDIENGLTKITAIDYRSRESIAFHNTNNVTNFAEADIKTSLENIYQELKSTNENAYNMIEPNTTWYLGTAGPSSDFHYKGTVCAIIDANVSMNDCIDKATSTTANIGLPRIGEMFTSNILRNGLTNFWTLTPYNSSYILNVSSHGNSYTNCDSTYREGIRPSMYLKSSVVIASNNTGNGTYEHPYEIEMSDFLINNGTEYTTNQTVTLSLFGGTGTQMCISNTETCTKYEDFTSTKTWTLTDDDGEKTVYVYYKDSNGNIVNSFNKSIILDTTAPSNNSIQISSEDNITRTLTLSSTGADYMCFSNTSSNVSDCTSWVDYKTTYNWTLTPNNGSKTVYAFFKDKVGNTASTSTSVTCNNCNVFMVTEDFSDTTYDSNLTIAGSDSYPWTVDTTSLYFRSNNKGVNSSSSTSTIQFTPTNASKLSFDWGVSSESNYDKLTIKLTGSDSSSVTLVNAQSGTKTGSITDQTLNANVTYTLTLTYTKDSSQHKNSDIGYIDNLHVGP